MLDATVTLVGNLTGNPEQRVTASGASVTSFRIASTPRFFDRTAGEWRDGDSLFISVTAWRQLAENVGQSLRRGDRAVVIGRLKQRTYETAQGERRTVTEIEADLVAADLTRATAAPRRVLRETSSVAAPAVVDLDADSSATEAVEAAAGGEAPLGVDPLTGEITEDAEALAAAPF